MTENRLHNILSRVVELKPGEHIISLLLFSYFFLIMAPYGIIKPLRKAKYLIEEGSVRLPIAYLLTAIIMGFFVAFYSKLQVKVHRRFLIISSLIFFIVTCFISGLFFIQGLTWMPLVFWIWANIFVVVLVTQFWILVNDIFNPREFKRLTGFFVSGGLLGSTFGALLMGILAIEIPEITDYLLFIASGMLITSVFVLNLIFIWQRKRLSVSMETDKKDKEGEEKQTKVGFKSFFDKARLSVFTKKAKKDKKKGEKQTKVGFKDCLNTVRKNYYLKLLAAVVTLTYVVSTFIDWQSNSVIDFKVDADDKTWFFGFFDAGLYAVPFFLSLLLTSKLIKRYGIRFTLLVYPLILFLCSLGIAGVPVLIFAVSIKGSDKTLSFSLNQTVRELLYLPISSEVKYKAKIFIDMFISRFAKGMGALILFIFIFLPMNWQLRVKIVSAISAVFILAWVFLNLKASKEYTNTVKQKLDLKWDRADRIVAEKLDVDYTKLIFDTIESRDRSSVLYAMHLFDLIKQDKLTPEVKKLISYKSDEIKTSSLATLFEAEEATWIPEADDQLSEEVLGKEIQEIMSLDVYKEVMKNHIDKVIVEKSQKVETGKMEVAKAIGFMEPSSSLVTRLEELINDESPEVSRYAVESAGKLKKREHVPPIIEKLQSPITREDASSTLEKYGSKITGTLSDYLGDPGEPLEVRKGLASVLARIGTQEAADFLSWELAREKGKMDAELIDAMDRVRSERPDVQFPKEIIEPKIAKEIRKYYKILTEHYESKVKSKEEEISDALPENLAAILRNIFDLLGLIYPRGDMVKAYQNIKTGTKDSVAYAVELVDNTLKKEIKDAILPIIEDLSLEERVRRCRALLKTSPTI